MALLKTILIILLVYYLFKILVRMFAPKIFGYAARKTEEHFKERFGDPGRSAGGLAQQDFSNEERVGDVIINKKPTPRNKNSKKVGDYIDFEEID